MGLGRRISWGAIGILGGAMMLSPGSAFAATQPSITGRLDARGYQVLAVAPSGATTVAMPSRNGRFRIRPAASSVTLHLRRAGRYAGPVVADSSGVRAVLGIRAGATLGVIRVQPGKRIARVRVDPDSTEVVASMWASARRGVPVGASSLGLTSRSRVFNEQMPGRDADRDGLINAFDVDDDGDMSLDNVDATFSATARSGSRSMAAAAASAGTKFRVFSNLKLGIDSSINANFSAMTKAEIDAVTIPSETLAIEVLTGDSTELDCGGLSYCTTGGTGAVVGGGSLQFPDDYDADGDGHGSITAGATGDFQLLTGGGALDVRSGDAYLQRVTTSGVETLVPGMLAYDFTSTPALVSYSDDGGAATSTVSYPVLPGGMGTQSNPYVVEADGSGQMVLTTTMWRPQRPRISPREARWMDIGGLTYSIDLPNAPGGGAGTGLCPSTAYSESDADLSVAATGLADSQVDRAAAAANTISFTTNISTCLGATTWDVGETLQVDLQARSMDGDNAAQKVWFLRAA